MNLRHVDNGAILGEGLNPWKGKRGEVWRRAWTSWGVFIKMVVVVVVLVGRGRGGGGAGDVEQVGQVGEPTTHQPRAQLTRTPLPDHPRS